MDDLRTALTHALNTHSAENGSSTPDFVLAKFLEGCLAAFNSATLSRDAWSYVGTRTNAPDYGSSETAQRADDVMLNGLTEAETMQTASVVGLVAAASCDDLASLNRRLAGMEDQAERAVAGCEELRSKLDCLKAAARAVVTRWYSPAWKEAGHTGNYIADLNAAILLCEGRS